MDSKYNSSSFNESDSEEEIIVYAEFEDSVDISKYRSVHVLGVNEKNPVIQMDDTFFIGKYESPLGTYMFFEEDPNPVCHDPLFDKLSEKNLKLLHKTRKVINMEHAYVTPTEGTEQELHKQLHNEKDDVKPIQFKSLQAALEKYQKEWKPPCFDRNVDNCEEDSKMDIKCEDEVA